jgi:hypothetical protein
MLRDRRIPTSSNSSLYFKRTTPLNRKSSISREWVRTLALASLVRSRERSTTWLRTPSAITFAVST